MTDPLRVLCILHSENGTLGRFERLLEGERVVLERSNFVGGSPPRFSAQHYDAIVVFGGRQSANDVHLECLRKEYAFLEQALKVGPKILGICLGGQILSRLLGSEEPVRELGSPELGFHSIEPIQEPYSGFWAHRRFFQWHWETMPCPRSANNLGFTPAGACQAFQCDSALAIQFHADADATVIENWLKIGADTVSRFSASSGDQLLAEARSSDAAITEWAQSLLSNWLFSEPVDVR